MGKGWEMLGEESGGIKGEERRGKEKEWKGKGGKEKRKKWREEDRKGEESLLC